MVNQVVDSPLFVMFILLHFLLRGGVDFVLQVIKHEFPIPSVHQVIYQVIDFGVYEQVNVEFSEIESLFPAFEGPLGTSIISLEGPLNVQFLDLLRTGPRGVLEEGPVDVVVELVDLALSGELELEELPHLSVDSFLELIGNDGVFEEVLDLDQSARARGLGLGEGNKTKENKFHIIFEIAVTFYN